MADDDAHSTAESEEWPDNDVDIYSPEGARAVKKSQAALYKAVRRQTEEFARQFRGPDKAYEIPAELYKKAESANDELTDDERALLMSRGDLIGKALAYPDSLTLEERYDVARWSPPGPLHAAIQKATNGAAETPEVLYALARKGPDDASHLTPEARHILAVRFSIDTEEGSSGPEIIHWIDVPGNGAAMLLLLKRAGIDFRYCISLAMAEQAAQLSVLQSATRPSQISMLQSAKRPPQDNPDDSDDSKASDDSDERPPKKRFMTRASRDEKGNPAWPGGYPPHLAEPCRLFFHDVMKPTETFRDKWFEDVEAEARERWLALGEDERARYVARAEELRSRAWDEHEQVDALLGRGESTADLWKKRLRLPGYDEFLAWQEQQLEKRTARFQSKNRDSDAGPVTRDTPAVNGGKRWPYGVRSDKFTPLGLFWQEQRDRYPGQELKDVWKVDSIAQEHREVSRLFDALSPEKRAVYDARSEELRQEAWDEADVLEAERARGEWTRGMSRKWSCLGK